MIKDEGSLVDKKTDRSIIKQLTWFTRKLMVENTQLKQELKIARGKPVKKPARKHSFKLIQGNFG